MSNAAKSNILVSDVPKRTAERYVLCADLLWTVTRGASHTACIKTHCQSHLIAQMSVLINRNICCSLTRVTLGILSNYSLSNP